MNLTAARIEEYDGILEFYDQIIDSFADAEYAPKWEKGVYPSRELIFNSIKNKELYYAGERSDRKACVILNHKYNEEYQSAEWSVDAADEELLVIHTLGVHPGYAGQGVATQLVQAVIEMAKDQNIRTIRLDVLEGNLPAECVYTNAGFQYVETQKMYYEDTGWTNFKLFEYIL